MPQGKVIYGRTGQGGVGTRVLGQQQRGQVTGTVKGERERKREREREGKRERERLFLPTPKHTLV